MSKIRHQSSRSCKAVTLEGFARFCIENYWAGKFPKFRLGWRSERWMRARRPGGTKGATGLKLGRGKSRYAVSVFFNDGTLPAVLLSRKLMRLGNYAKAALLHEMIHVWLEHDGKHGPEHGKKFRKERDRIVRLGALDVLF